MSKENSLEKYTKAIDALESHKESNKAVFEEHQKLVFEVIDAENVLRDDVAEANAGVENGSYKVIVTPQTQTYGDVEAIDKLVADRIISPELRNKIVVTTQRPAKITIQKK